MPTPPERPTTSILLLRPVATIMAAGIGLALMAGLVRLGLTLMRDPTGELIVLGFAAIGVVIVWAIAVVFRAMDL
jgi:hypothetical protein